jgi:hypothetical protein
VILREVRRAIMRTAGTDQRAWHLSGSRPLVERTFREDQRPALAVADGHRTDPLGGTAMGEAGQGSAGVAGGMPDEGLPFLTILAPSARWSETNGKPHKTLTTWARQAILQTKRWLPDRRLIFVGDSGFAALDLLAAVRCHVCVITVCVITRLRLDANLFKPARGRKPGQRGRTPPRLFNASSPPGLSLICNCVRPK